MDKKAICEIRKLIKPDSCVDRIRGCYVNEEGQIIHELHDSLASMEKESLEKYCEILRGALSGKLGRNLFNMEFPIVGETEGSGQQMLYRLQQSGLKDDSLLTEFFEDVVKHFRCDSKYLILLIHGTYDIPAKGSDNAEMEDASDYVYSFLLCCICPVILMKEGLCYDEDACTFLDRRMDWAVQTFFTTAARKTRATRRSARIFWGARSRSPKRIRKSFSSPWWSKRSDGTAILKMSGI